MVLVGSGTRLKIEGFKINTGARVGLESQEKTISWHLLYTLAPLPSKILQDNHSRKKNQVGIIIHLTNLFLPQKVLHSTLHTHLPRPIIFPTINIFPSFIPPKNTSTNLPTLQATPHQGSSQPPVNTNPQAKKK